MGKWERKIAKNGEKGEKKGKKLIENEPIKIAKPLLNDYPFR